VSDQAVNRYYKEYKYIPNLMLLPGLEHASNLSFRERKNILVSWLGLQCFSFKKFGFCCHSSTRISLHCNLKKERENIPNDQIYSWGHACRCVCVCVCVNYYSQVKHNDFFTNILYLQHSNSTFNILPYKMQLVTRLTNTSLCLVANYVSYTATATLHEMMIHNRTYR
jgi:hypothetical protein